MYGIIENGVVANVIVADADFAESTGAVLLAGGAAIGWRYDGGEFMPPLPVVLVAPSAVTMRQARLALLNAGHLADVDAAISSLPSPDRERARIEWDYARDVVRDSPLIRLLGPALGLDDAELDTLFTEAVTL